MAGAQDILKSRGALTKFLESGRLQPGQARALRARAGTVRKQAGKAPGPGEVRGLFGKGPKPKPAPRKPPKGKRKPPHRLLPIRPDRKGPRRIKKPAERI